MVLLARGSVTVTAVNDGVPEKLYRAWSNNADGSGFSTTDSSGKYLGTYVGLSEPTSASQYKWTLIKGETGEPGQPGVSAYLHTAWANSANGQTGFSTSVSTDKLYIGTYSSSSPTPSQSYTNYKWVRVKGLDAKFYSVIVDKSFLNRNGLSSTATETIKINSYVHEGNSAGVAAPGFFIIKEQIKQTTAGVTTYVFQEKHRSTTAVSQLNYTVSANAVTVKIEFYLTNQFNNLFAVRDIGVLMDASTDIEARVPIAQLIENINNHPSTTLISGAKLHFTNDVTFDQSFHTKLFAETGFIENLGAYEFSADNITTGTLEADHIKGGTLDFDLIHAENFSADNIISGTIDAGIVNIDNLSASRIKTGNLDVSSGLKITSGNHQIMSIDPETLNLEFNVNEMSIGGVKLISEDDQPQMEENIATELESKIKPYLHIAYANNATGTSGFSISDSLNKLYIGTYTNYTSTQSTDPSKYKWVLIKGEKGTTGVGLQSITEWYLATPLKEGVTRTTSGWKDSVQTLSSVNNYLWNYEQINYDNGTKHYTDPTIIGTFGEQGISVKGVTEYYLASPLSEGITKDTPGWTTDIQPLTPENKYLWNKEIVHYSDDAAFLDKTEILSGTEIFTDKADEEAVVHVEIDGKSYQHAGSGKNLLNFSGEERNASALTQNGLYYAQDLKPFADGKTYTLSFEGKSTNANDTLHYSIARNQGNSVITLKSNVTFTSEYKTYSESFTFTQGTDANGIWFVNRSANYPNNTGEIYIRNLQLEEGSTATAYEPPAPSPEYPIEIHSLNDFNVVSSVGYNNQFLNTDFKNGFTHWKTTNADGGYQGNEGWSIANRRYAGLEQIIPHYESLKGHVLYGRVELKSDSQSSYFVFFNDGFGQVTRSAPPASFGDFYALSAVSTINDEAKHIYCKIQDARTEGWTETRIRNLYVLDLTEIYGKGNEPTQSEMDALFKDKWAPSTFDITEDGSNHPSIDKTNLSLDEPLRSVEDVKDRLFRDSDGLWKVERNVGEITLSGSHFKRYPSATIAGLSKFYTTSIGVNSQNPYKIDSPLMTNQFKMLPINDGFNGSEVGISTYTSGTALYGILPSSVVPDTEGDIISWFNRNPLNILFQKQESTIETLSQSLQNKLNNLRTFKNSNYVYTVLPNKSNILSENLEPTLHAKFKSKAWAGNFAGYPSIIGVYGDSAKLLYLSTSADSMTFNSDGSANPASQTITFTGNLQNVLGNVIFTAIAYNGTTVVSTISLSGVGNTRTLTQAQFPASADRVQVKATLGNLEDTVTIVKLKNGADAIVGYLTNESVTLSANNAGTVSSFVPASGTFKVFEGTIDRTSSTATSFRVKTQTGAVATINSSSGAYAVSSMSSDSANIVFEATYKNIKIDQTLSLSKSKEGVKGIPGPQGVSITKVDVQYYLSTSNDSLVGGGWSTTAPAWIDGRFMWSKTVTTYTSGSPTESKPVCITGAKGSTGGTGSIGATGRGVSTIVEQFYLSNSKETQTGGSWSTTMPTWSPGKYVWTRSLITYTTGTPPTSTTEPLVSSEWEAINELEIGGRNLILDSGTPVESSAYMVAEYFISEDFVEGQEYTATIKGTKSSAVNFGVWQNTGSSGRGSFEHVKDDLYQLTFTSVATTAGNERRIRIYQPPSGSGGKATIEWIKLEKGNKATDWSPAPEDVTASIKAAQDKADAASQEAIAAQADATVGKNMADNLSNDSIITQVEKLELKREWDAIVKEKPSITIQATDYALQSSTEATAYNTAYTALNNSIPSLLANMNVTSGVTRTTFNTNFANYYDKRQLLLNRIAKKAKELADVAQSSVDNLEIGGRNLLLNSSFATGSLSKWSNNGSVTFANVDGRNTAYLNTSSGIYQSQIVKDRGLHTLSFMAKALDNTTSARVGFLNAGSGASIVFSLTNTWQRYEFTTSISIDTSQIFHIYSSGKRYYITDIKLEKGNKPTAWTPAPEDVEAAYTAVAEAKAEAERIKAEVYADGKVTAEEQARIDDVNAKLAAAKKHAEDQINISEGKATSWKKTYSVNQPSPLKLTKLNGDALSPLSSYEVSAKVLGTGTVTSATSLFKAKESGGQSSNGWELVTIYTRGTNSNHPEFFIDSDGDPAVRLYNHTSKYTVEVTHTEYSGSQSSYTLSQDVARAEAELVRIKAEAYAATAKGIADGAVSSASTANSLLADIASDSKLTATEKKAAKKEWDIIVGEKPKIDSSADTYSITTQKTAYNTAYNALNTYLSSLLSNLNTTSNIVGTTFRANFRTYYNARQDLLNAIADGAKSLVDNLEIGGRNYFYTSLAKSSGRNSITLEPNTQYIMSTNIPKRDDGGAHIFVGPEGFTASSDTTGAYAGKNISFTTTGTGIVEFHFSSFNPDWVTSGYYHIQLEKGNKATDWSPAPEDAALDINKKTYNPVRYIRDWANGSTANTSNHWYEIQAIDTSGNNIALGKTVRSNASASLFPVVTDGNTAGTYASGSGNMKAYMEVDLGSVYYNISEIKVWRYHNDGRTYYDTKTEVSKDGNNWYPIFDSKIEDEYSETSAGRTYPNTQAKSEGLLSAYHTTERLESATSKVVINGGNITAGRIQDSLKRNDLNLDNGTFKFANGNIEYNGTKLVIKTGVEFGALPSDTQTKINAGAAAEANAKKYVDDNTGNLVNNPAATGNHTGWTGSGLSSLNQTFEGISTRVIQTSTSSNVQYYSSYFKVDPSKAYEVSAWFKKSVANSSGYYLGLNGIDTSGSGVGFVHTTQTGAISNANNTNFYFDSGTAPTDWVKVVGYIMPVGTNASDMKNVGTNSNAIMKQNIDRIRVRFLNWNNGGTTRQLWVANPKVVEVDPNAIITAAQAKTLTDTWVHPGTTQINGNNIRTGTLDAKIITTGILSANNGTSTLNMNTGDMVMNGNFNLGSGALQWNKTNKTLSIKANSLKIGSYDAASKNDVEQTVQNIEIGGRNLVVLRDIYYNTYISTNGTTAVATGHATTAYIEVLPNQDYVWSASNINQLRVAYYTSSKAYISTDFRGGDQGSVVRFKTSSNAAFIRVSAQSPSLGTWKIEKGSHPTDWTPSTDDVYQYVDDVEIGGTQLLDGTSNEYTYLNLGQWYTTIVGGATKPFADYGLSIGDTITYRVYIKSTSGNGGIARLTIFEANGGYTTRIGSAIENGAEGYSTVTYTIESDRTQLSVGIQNSVNTGVSTSAINYKEPKLEKGVKATAWSMSQNDYQMIVDSVEVGGDNLLRIGEWSGYPSYNTTPVVSHNGRRITFTKNNHNSIAISNARLPYGPNIYYVISGYAKIDDQPVTNATWGSYRSASTYQGSTTYFNVRDSDGYFVIVQNWTNSSQWLFHASNLMPSLNGTITIDDFMVQAGNKPSGWKLNPEDERVGGENLLYNSDFSKTAGGAAFTVGGIRYATYPARWGGYNGGVNNATTNYHMHLDDNTFGYNVVEFNESNGTRHWKGGNISLDGLVKSPGFYTVSVDLYATGSETRLFGGFYYYKKGGTTMSFHAGQYSISPNVINNWKRYSALHELPDDVDLNQNIRFYMYGYGFGTNSILYVRKIQLQEGTIASSWSLSTEDVEEMISLKADQSGTSTILQSMQDAIDIALQEQTAAGLQNELSAFIKSYNAKQEAEALEKIASEKRIKDIEERDVLTDTHYGDMVGVKTFIDRTFYEGEEGLMIKNGKEGTHILINDQSIDFFSNGTKTAYISQNKLSISDGTFIENLQIGDISASNETSRSHLTFRYTPQK